MGRTLLEKIANVMIVGAAAAVIATHVRSFGSAPPPPPPGTETYARGETIPEWAAILPAGERTLLVYINSRCRFCTASMPFYSRAVSRTKSVGTAHVVIASRESAETTGQYLHEHGVNGAVIVSLPGGFAPKLRPTPTVLLVDGAGRVEHAWRGQLSPGVERDVLAAAGLLAEGSGAVVDLRPLLVVSAQLLAAIVLAYAGMLKLRKKQDFVETVRRFQLVPPSAAHPIAVLLPWIELAGALGLVLAIVDPRAFDWAAALAVVLFATFTTTLSLALLKGRRDLSCGCFGHHSERISWLLVGRCSLLLVAAAGGVFQVNNPSVPGAQLVVIMAAAGIVAGALLLVRVGSTVWHLRRQEFEPILKV